MTDLFMDMGAKFSPCRTWRYSLWRVWDNARPPLTVIGLNPSTADETTNDPTITRCINRARDGNFGSLLMLNIFAYRATDPAVLWDASEAGGIDIQGPGNREAFNGLGADGMAICAWGVGGAHLNQDRRVMLWLQTEGVKPYCLGVTKEGFPKHPLYLRRDVQPVPYEGRP